MVLALLRSAASEKSKLWKETGRGCKTKETLWRNGVGLGDATLFVRISRKLNKRGRTFGLDHFL
jgi:hypothetical protein